MVDFEVLQPYQFTNFSSQFSELSQLQSYERANFSAYQEILQTIKRFKKVSNRCSNEITFAERMLKNVEPALKDSIRKTFDELSNQRKQIDQRLQQVRDGKDEILSLYRDGIAALKRYELHPKLAKEGKANQHLIDIYYAESSMDNFRKNLVGQLDKVTAKMDDLKRDFQFKFPALINISTATQSPAYLHDQLVKVE